MFCIACVAIFMATYSEDVDDTPYREMQNAMGRYEYSKSEEDYRFLVDTARIHCPKICFK
jgi:hypothetical protein